MQTAVAEAARHVVVRLREHLAGEVALTRVAGLLLAAATLAIGITLWDLRQIVIADAVMNTDNLANVLADETSHLIQAVDVVLRDIQERIAAQGVTTPGTFHQLLRTREMHEFLRSRVDRLPQIDNIALIAADGIAVNDAVQWSIPGSDLSQRDYVRHFAGQNDPGLFISEPLTSRATNQLSVNLVRRVNGPHGEFLGVVLGSVPLMMFHELYATINLPPSESLMLLRRDGTVLARHPDPIDRSGTRMPPDSPWYAEAEQGGGHYESFGVYDRTIRLVSVWPLRDYPLVLDVAVNEEAALAHWRREAIVIGLGTAIALGFMLLLLYRLRLQFHRLEASRSILTIRNADLTRSAEALRASETSLAAISRELETTLSSMHQGLIMIDAAGQIAVCNPRAIEMLGLSALLMAQRPFLQAVPALQWIADELDLTGSLPDDAGKSAPMPAMSCRREHELSTGIILEVGWVPVAAGGGWVVTCQDITARRRAEAEVAFVARHDALTRLPNRVMFRERLEFAIAQAERAIAASVLFLDLDHFKAVNDTLGHPVGDCLLRMVADRLEACVRQVDMVARFGGDEFGVIQSGPERIEDVAVLAQRIIDVLSMPYQLDDHQVTIGVSIGIALAPTDGSDPDTLLKHADIALYRAKAEGRGIFRLFEPAMDARLHERRLLELDLRHALAHDEFELFYQPLVDVASQRICGFEALMRWNHPTRGLLKPDLFISTTEEMGLIVPLGRWALREACREATSWPDDLKVAVNLSVVQFGSGDLVRAVTDALDQSGLPPRRLNLEITESLLLQDTQEVLEILHELRDLGVSISMDDFGTGYSSLSYLRSFPFDKIKIDQSFIRDLAHNVDAAAIVRAVTGLGNALGMATTAEGVETYDQFTRLQAEGCTEVQGYFFSQAISAAQIPDLLGKFHSRVPPDGRLAVAERSVTDFM